MLPRTRSCVRDRTRSAKYCFERQFDINDGLNVFSEYVKKIIKTGGFAIDVYSPNLFNKGDCRIDGGPSVFPYCLGIRAQCMRYPQFMSRPNEFSYWRASYRWHLVQRQATVILRIVVDSVLGEGQKIESLMAKDLRIHVIEIKVSTSSVAVSRSQFFWFCVGPFFVFRLR